MAPKGVMWQKARRIASLAFLTLGAFLALALASSVDGRVMAFTSPQSPVVPAEDDTLSSLAQVVQSVPDARPRRMRSVWRVRISAGLIVLGVALVIGGMLWITDKEVPTGSGQPGAPGEHDR